ncbi:hypothetical protein [Acinetobacter sp. WZC-1]|uniref:hypothetical protein n=1 Tax=Acinetobacter sp. WZC-1 TaxID=3459034 RepID=UPI00403E05A4
MTNVTTLTFNKTSKAFANTRYEGAYINRDSAFEQHQVKVVVTQENQQQELIYQVVPGNAFPAAKLLNVTVLDSQLQEEATKFAQSIVAFHQDKDSYTLSLLDSYPA